MEEMEERNQNLLYSFKFIVIIRGKKELVRRAGRQQRRVGGECELSKWRRFTKTPWAQAPPANQDARSSHPRDLLVEGENQRSQAVLWPSHVPCPETIHKQNVNKNLKKSITLYSEYALIERFHDCRVRSERWSPKNNTASDFSPCGEIVLLRLSQRYQYDTGTETD